MDKQICRLCLDIIPPGDAEVIGEKKKTILEVLLINVDLHITDNAVACSRCMEEVQSGFEFKSACFHVDNCISTFADADVPVDLKKMFQAEMPDTAMANVNLDNRHICRLCMSLIEGEALDCNTDLKDIIANCLADVDIHKVHEPLVCELCFSRMKKLNELMNTCQEVERRIDNYLQAGVDFSIPLSVNLKDLLKFKGNTIKEESSNFDGNLLQEPKKEDTATIECEEIHIKDELDSGDEIGDSLPSRACDKSGKSGSLKSKRQIRQCTSKGSKHFSANGHMARYKGLTKMFACQECTYKTDCKRSLAQHSLRHKDKSKMEMHQCKICEFETKWKNNMINHMVKHRNPKRERKFKCDKCPYEMDIMFCLRRHNLRHTDKSEGEILKCDNCEYETLYKGTMIKHMVKHRNTKAEGKYKCDKCPYETNNKYHLCRHTMIHKDISEVEMHNCEKNCGYQTKYKYDIKHHMIKHMGSRAQAEIKLKCDKCPFETDFMSSLRRHSLIHKDKSDVEMHKYENCEYETWQEGSLIRHMVQHRDPKTEKKFKCDKCLYESNDKSNMCRHNLMHKNKSEVEMLKCHNCEFETRHKCSMIRHMTQHHRDPKTEKKIKCDISPYETNYKFQLSMHNLTHKDKSEVEMRKCENCEFETRRMDNMKQHIMRVHRNPTEERKFKCDKCLYETDFKVALCQHNLIHKDKSEVEMYKCENCEYETLQKSILLRHKLQHREPETEKKFKCDKCLYETNYKSNLYRHNLMHKDKSEVEMLKCYNCEFETRHKRSMMLHMARHRDPRAEKEVKCVKCPYRANNKSHLCRHNMIHKDISEVETHICEKNCGYETKHKYDMKQHMIKHMGSRAKAEIKLKCDKCPFATDFMFSLRRHSLIHKDKSEVEMHKCYNCEYETLQKSSLIWHMLRKHRDPKTEKKFKCDKCTYKTDFMSYLRRHSLIHKDKSEVEMHKCYNCEYETLHKSSLIRHMLRKHRDPKTETKFKCDK